MTTPQVLWFTKQLGVIRKQFTYKIIGLLQRMQVRNRRLEEQLLEKEQLRGRSAQLLSTCFPAPKSWGLCLCTATKLLPSVIKAPSSPSRSPAAGDRCLEIVNRIRPQCSVFFYPEIEGKVEPRGTRVARFGERRWVWRPGSRVLGANAVGGRSRTGRRGVRGVAGVGGGVGSGPAGDLTGVRPGVPSRVGPRWGCRSAAFVSLPSRTPEPGGVESGAVCPAASDPSDFIKAGPSGLTTRQHALSERLCTGNGL